MGTRLTLKDLDFPSVGIQHIRQDGLCCGDTRFLLQSLEEDVHHHVSDPKEKKKEKAVDKTKTANGSYQLYSLASPALCLGKLP
jgi:hypothetical protein